jgi:hypothetical protein
MNKDITIDASKYSTVAVRFGSHYFLEINSLLNGSVDFKLGYTHHGIFADASGPNSELEVFINELRKKHTKNLID